jgi:bacillithiol biosynthesis deacetylase BshB1
VNSFLQINVNEMDYFCPMENYQVDVLCIAAHPDDVEISAGGTVAKLIAQGYTVAIVDFTQGELGSRGSGPLRLKEAAEASRILNVKYRENLGLKDGFFQYDEESLKLIIEVVRKYKPTIVLTNALRDRHPDHARAAKMVSDACFYSGLNKIEGMLHWRPKAVYHFNQDQYNKPDFVVDVTDFWDVKMASLMAYRSQFYDPQSKEPETPISGEGFFDYLKARAIDFGRPAGYQLAEGFQVARVPGVHDIMGLQ